MTAVVARALVLDMVVPGDPMPWRRVRRGKGGGAYVPAEVLHAEEALGYAARAAGARTPVRGPVAIELGFYRRTNRRADADNLMKMVLDAFNEVVWRDDSQVVEWSGVKRVDPSNPRTEVRVWKLEQ